MESGATCGETKSYLHLDRFARSRSWASVGNKQDDHDSAVPAICPDRRKVVATKETGGSVKQGKARCLPRSMLMHVIVCSSRPTSDTRALLTEMGKLDNEGNADLAGQKGKHHSTSRGHSKTPVVSLMFLSCSRRLMAECLNMLHAKLRPRISPQTQF